jgi:hypothetical protein
MIPRKLVCRLLLLCLSTVPLAPAAAITGTPSWKPRETVAEFPAYESYNGSDRALSYDHHGNPGTVYLDGTTSALSYARRVPGVGWVTAEVDASSFAAGPSLAYDRYERPTIAYTNSSGVRFARFDGASWQLQTAVASGGSFPSLANDILGRPAIAYTNSGDFSLKYIRDTDGDFSFTDETPITANSQSFAGGIPSLVFDPLNRPMVAAWDVMTDELKFSVEEPGIGWVTAVIDTVASPPGFAPSLAIDPDTGYPAIAYGGGTTGLRFAAWNGDAWDLTTIDSTLDYGSLVSLAFDPADGHPAISYASLESLALRIAWHNGSTWQTQTVDGTNGFNQSSLAFNDFGNGFPSIVYVNPFGTYFIEDPPLAVPEPATAVLMLAGLAAVYRRRTDITG